MVHLPKTNIFFWKKLLRSFSSVYRLLSLCKILKRFLQRIQSYEDAPFLGPKWPIRSNESFFRKTVNKNCSFHSCLSACQKSKSDINLLVKYWRLKNTEMSLAWEPDFSQACSFRRMLMNHKNFRFTQIPDKTKKVQKPCFWAIFDHFWSFLPDGDFFQKVWLSRTLIYMDPKKLKSQFWEKLWTEGRSDGWWKDNRPYVIGPFWPRPGVK